MYKRIALIALLLLALCIMPVSAEWVIPSYLHCSASSEYLGGGYTLSNMFDNNGLTRWSAAVGDNPSWVNWTNPTEICYDQVRLYGTYTATTSVSIKNSTDKLLIGTGSVTVDDVFTEITLSNPQKYSTDFIFDKPGSYASFGELWVNNLSPSLCIVAPPAPPIVSFVCNANPWDTVPVGYGLTCTDASAGTVTYVNWTLTQPDASEYTSTNATLVKSLPTPGWYGIEYEACNSVGCGYANATNFINVTSGFIPETGISFWVHTYDPITGAKIGPSDIGIGNTTSGGWRNSSTNLGTAKFDSTDYARLEKLTVGQNVNLCGEAPGYQETCTNVSIAYDGWEYILNLVRTDLVPAGNQSTMIVNVINSNTAQTIPGVSLTISNSSVPYSSSKLSDSNGIATFSNIPAAGSYQISASKTGYVSATKFWPVYPGAVANAYIGMLPVGVTPVTTGPGGDPIYITPTTTTTYAPGETPDTRTDAEKDEDMMNLLRDQGPMLIQFFIVCFVVYMVMGMAGKGGR